MGLADFLATAGQGKTLGHVAEAFGGQTTKQKAVDDFINNQLPAMADQIHKASTKEDITKAGQTLIMGGLKAGINPQGLDKLMEMTIQPALRNLQTGEIDKLRTDYGAQPGLEASPRPESSPSLVKGPNVPATPALPERPLDLNFAMRLGQATGAKTDDLRQLIETPATVAAKQASTQHTQTQIDAEKAKQDAISGLSNTPQEPGQPSLQATARINPGGIQQFLPVRQDQGKEDYQNQLLGLKQQGLDNALSIAGQRIGAANDRADLATSRAGFNQEAELRKEFQGQSKDFQTVRDSYNRVKSALQAQTPAGDMSGIYNWMSQQDPRSTVRESEFRMAETAKPLLERMGLSWNTIGALWQGKKLTPGQRADFLARSQELYDSANQQHQKRVGEYSRVAKESGLNPSRVITDMEATGEAPAAPAGQGRYSEGVPSGSGSGAAPAGQGAGAPAVGTISKGYRFKGGNPAGRNSWEKVQ